MDFFLFKKIVSAVLLPLPLFFLLSIPGLLSLWFGKGQKAGRTLLTIGIAWLALFSWSPVPRLLLEPLEKTYPAVDPNPSGANEKARFIVVLGGGHSSDPDVPPSGQLSGYSLARLVEGITLYRKTPGAKLLLSGYGHVDSVSNARMMATVAESLGIDKKDILLEERPRDTKNEAKLLSERVGKNPFFLVTSASHMPRAVALFEKQGANPIPASTAHRIKNAGDDMRWEDLFPQSGNIENAEVAFHERLGKIWAWLAGQI